VENDGSASLPFLRIAGEMSEPYCSSGRVMKTIFTLFRRFLETDWTA
jgi:hypothetical protein